MINLFDLFKIIFGIIISAFVLVMVLRLSTSLTEVGETGAKAGTLAGLRKAIQDVYTTGISSDFEIRDAEKTIDFYLPPNIISDLGPLNLEPVPTFFVKGEDILICRGVYDLGWWEFHFALATPETKIIFVPLNSTDIVWKTIKDTVSLIPSTHNLESRITFGFGCNGTGTNQSYFHSSSWDSEYFLNRLIYYIPGYTNSSNMVIVPCEKRIEEEGYRTMTFSEGLAGPSFVVVPLDSKMGYVYINSSAGLEKYLYKTPLDVIALFFGGKESYDYANRVFFKELGISTSLKIRETSLLMYKKGSECTSFYSSFLESLNNLRNTLSTNYTSESDMTEFREWLDKTVERNKLLEAVGC